jgi:hypothetical protein
VKSVLARGLLLPGSLGSRLRGPESSSKKGPKFLPVIVNTTYSNGGALTGCMDAITGVSKLKALVMLYAQFGATAPAAKILHSYGSIKGESSNPGGQFIS